MVFNLAAGLGKSRQVWYGHLGLGTLGTQAATANSDIRAIGSCVRVPLGTLGSRRRREILMYRLLAKILIHKLLAAGL